MYLWETSYKLFFGKIAQAPYYTNLVDIQITTIINITENYNTHIKNILLYSNNLL